MSSFADGQTVSLATKNHAVVTAQVAPYNANLDFNKIINPKNTDPENTIYSIDIAKILRAINNDDMAALYQITLACRPAHQTIGLWDTLFNSTQYRSETACVFVAQHNFEPIPRQRVASSSPFLDLSHPTTRTHLNKIVSGDVIGVAVSEPRSGFTYILLYEAEDQVVVRLKATNDDSPSTIVPAVNVTMHHALRLDHTDPGTAVVIPMGDKDYDHDVAGPFVARLADAVLDIREAYPWKPHFLPSQPGGFDRGVIEARLTESIASAEDIDYTTFENNCRSLYQTAGANRPARDNTPREVSKPGQQRKRPKARDRSVQLPIIEVVSVDDTYYVTLPGSSNMVKFTNEDLGNQQVVEQFLTNQDLANILVEESTLLLILSASFGEKAYLRYFTLNF